MESHRLWSFLPLPLPPPPPPHSAVVAAVALGNALQRSLRGGTLRKRAQPYGGVGGGASLRRRQRAPHAQQQARGRRQLLRRF